MCRCGYTDSKARNRTLISDFSGNGKMCPHFKETSQCELTPCNCTSGYYGTRCDKRDCRLGQWSNWSPCVKPCPGGTCPYDSCPTPPTEYRTRTRSVQIEKVGNGTSCNGHTRETTTCARCIKNCTPDPFTGTNHICRFVKP